MTVRTNQKPQHIWKPTRPRWGGEYGLSHERPSIFWLRRVEETDMQEREQLIRDAHAVFLPAIDSQSLPTHIAEHLAAGGISVLLGESREEYVARKMSPERQSAENTEWFSAITGEVRSRARGEVLIAVDQELGGIQRLHGLVTSLPSPADVQIADSWTIKSAASRLADECAGLGVNVVLAPIVDVVTGSNPWLNARTVSSDVETVRRVATSFVYGLQSSGQIAATAKHFPGHPVVPLDPAVDAASVAEATRTDLAPSLDAFNAVINAGVKVVMMGPTLVPAFDPVHASSRSADTVHYLRTDLGFGGVVLSDALDAPATLRGRSLEETAVEALIAGVDWLLVAGTPQLPDLVRALLEAVDREHLPSARIHEAARAVKTLAHDIG